MTDRDVLKRASEALRDATEPTAEDVARLRARVLSRGKVTPLRRSDNNKKLRWILPLAAAFIAASAFAATPGAFDGMLHAVERYLDVELFGRSHETARAPNTTHVPKQSAPAAAEPTKLAAVEPEPDLVPLDLPEPAMPEAPAQQSSSSDARRSARAAVPSHPNQPARAEETALPAGAEAAPEAKELPTGPSRDLVLYNKAHALHFKEHRYNEALFAWEEYLGLTPAPTFALEARYNRALCLLRLGHYEEARAALVPFAEGRYVNGYRHEEATRFIQALDKRR